LAACVNHDTCGLLAKKVVYIVGCHVA
jgi:hypothetical protein